MENGKKIKSWKFKKVMVKSWNFSSAYRELRMFNSDNFIYIGLLQCFGYGRRSVYVRNRNVVHGQINASLGLLPSCIVSILLLKNPNKS